MSDREPHCDSETLNAGDVVPVGETQREGEGDVQGDEVKDTTPLDVMVTDAV